MFSVCPNMSIRNSRQHSNNAKKASIALSWELGFFRLIVNTVQADSVTFVVQR